MLRVMTAQLLQLDMYKILLLETREIARNTIIELQVNVTSIIFRFR